MGLAADGWKKPKNHPFPIHTQNLLCLSHNNEIWHSHGLTKEDTNIYVLSETPLEFCWHQNFSQAIFLISGNTDKNCILVHNLRLFWLLFSFQINMIANVMISIKLVTPGLIKITVFWNKVYDAIIHFYDVINKVPSRDSNYIDIMVIWTMLGNSSIWLEKQIFWEVV